MGILMKDLEMMKNLFNLILNYLFRAQKSLALLQQVLSLILS